MENSDEDFDCCSKSNIGEGDSADDDCDIEFKENPTVQNNTFDNDAVFRTWPVERQFAGYTWVDKQPRVNKVTFSKTACFKTRPPGYKPINYFSMLFTDELIELVVQKTNLYAVELFIFIVGNLSSRISQ